MTQDEALRIAALACDAATDYEWGFDRDEAIDRLCRDWPDYSQHWPGVVDQIRPPIKPLPASSRDPLTKRLVEESMAVLQKQLVFSSMVQREYEMKPAGDPRAVRSE